MWPRANPGFACCLCAYYSICCRSSCYLYLNCCCLHSRLPYASVCALTALPSPILLLPLLLLLACSLDCLPYSQQLPLLRCLLLSPLPGLIGSWRCGAFFSFAKYVPAHDLDKVLGCFLDLASRKLRNVLSHLRSIVIVVGICRHAL